MTQLFRDLSLGPSMVETSAPTIMPAVAGDLPSPFGELAANLTDSDLRLTAYEIFVLVCRPNLGKHLRYVSNKTMNSVSPKSPTLQRSSGQGKPNQLTVGELMRNQMKVSEAMEFRLRRALMKLSLEKVLMPMRSVVVPLELLLQLKLSDFTDQEEYEEWHKRELKVLEAGLLMHPRKPLDMSKASAQRHLQIIDGASDRHILYWTNSENMQSLSSAVDYFAWSRYDDSDASDSCHWPDGIPSDSCHWADGIPLNLRLYEVLLQSCFDINDESSIIVEFDELLEHIEKTWGILGMNQKLHNLCFPWVLFHRFVATGRMQASLLHAVDIKLSQVERDAKRTKDPEYSKILSSTLSSILGWSDTRLLAYHETFDPANVETMRNLVSLTVAAAKIWAENIAFDRRSEVNVARDRIDTYIRSSLRATFAQIKEKADSSGREPENQQNAFPALAILAKDVSSLAVKEKQVFSPILKRWHPLAALVAVATLYSCYANELKPFISGISELTPDHVRVLRAAYELERGFGDTIREEDEALDSDDDSLDLLREINTIDAFGTMAILLEVWIERRLNGLKEQVDRNLQLELWSLQGNCDGYAPSAAEVLRMINETLDAFFQLPIGYHHQFLPELINGLDRCLQNYVTKATSGCGSRDTFVPTLPPLTRCTTGRKSQGSEKKKEKSPILQKGNPQGATNVHGILQLCTRLNTLQWIQSESGILEKRINTLLCNSESGSKGLVMKFKLYPVAFVEGTRQLCEAVGYRIVFHDLRHLLWDGLYIGNPSSSRINPFLAELEQYLTIIPDAVHEKMRTRVLTDIMRASFDGFVLVLLGGGPSRAFSLLDSQIIEDDFKSLKDLFSTKGDSLPSELIDQFSATVRSVLHLFRTDTESLIKRFREVTPETRRYFAKSGPSLPSTSGQWDPVEPNTLLRVLCHRNDKSASKFLKKTYKLPKNL